MRKMLFFVALFISFAVFSQGEIKGVVIDQETNEPIPFANVVLKVGEEVILGTTTEFYGKYHFKEVPANEYTLEVSYIGYQKKSFEKLQLKEGKTLQQNAALTEGIKLKEVVIVEYAKPLITGCRCYFGGCSRRCDIERMPIRSEEKDTVEEQLHAEELVLRKLKAYPSPSKGDNVLLLYTTTDRRTNLEVEVELIDLLGKRIYFNELTVVNGQLKLPLWALSTAKPGAYFVRLKDQQNVLSQKIVVSR